MGKSLGLVFDVSEIDFPIRENWLKNEIFEVMEDELCLKFNNTIIDDVIYFTEIDGFLTTYEMDEYNWPKGTKFRGEWRVV